MKRDKAKSSLLRDFGLRMLVFACQSLNSTRSNTEILNHSISFALTELFASHPKVAKQAGILTAMLKESAMAEPNIRTLDTYIKGIQKMLQVLRSGPLYEETMLGGY